MSLLTKLRSIFKNKQVIVVSDFGIKTKEITNLSRFLHCLVCVWFVFTTIMFFVNIKLLSFKNKKIQDLEDVNASLNIKITDISYLIEDVNNYLFTLNSYDRFNDINIKNLNTITAKINSNSHIGVEEYKKILPIINNIERDISNVEIMVDSRISGLNNLLKEVSLDSDAREMFNISYNKFGLKNNSELISKHSILVKKSDFAELKNKVKYMNFLESFLNSIPIAKPMKNYYISSKFGSRIDPFTKQVKLHNGLDFVGPYKSFIYAPADGVVDIVGKRGGFGNSIEIDHGNDIKTEYAHLDSSLVKTGDIVKRGDKIAIQGSTGRSTGQHLHWEVRVRNKNIDPMKFVKVGEKLF